MPSSKFNKILFLAGVMTVLCSCSYSIRIANRDGVPNPDITHRELGVDNLNQVSKIDTVVSLGVLENGFTYFDTACKKGSFYSVEYKITFGAILRNTFTFGKRRSVKVKCTCSKN